MAGDHHVWRLSMATFQAFRDDRPKEEKWELIDGRPTMMAPPSRIHQRICRNMQEMLNARLALVRPEWQADQEIGILLPGDTKYNPEPDIVVADATIAFGEIYAEHFYAVVEVLSPNDKDWVLDLKLGYYQSHEPCASVLFVEQTRIACQVWRRVGGTWTKADLTLPSDRLDLPEIGDIGPLGDCSRHTPLARVEV
jgi:Uma2 family endonuclease